MLTSVLKLSLPTLICVISMCFLKVASVEKENNNHHCVTCVEGIHPGCGDPFDTQYIDRYTTDCSLSHNRPDTNENEHRDEYKYKDKSPVGCRKILQEINDKIHVVRQCAYSGENVNGLKRTGNKGVKLWYYQCDDAKHCNGAIRLNSISFFFIAITAISSIVFLFIH